MDGVLTPLLAGLVVSVLVVTIWYTLVSIRALVARARRRLAKAWRRSRGFEQGESYEWFYRERASSTSSSTASAGSEELATEEASTGGTRATGAGSGSDERASEAINEARSEAEAVVRAAELRARDVLEQAERESRLLRQQLVDERRQLSSLLHSLLEEVRRGSGEETADVRNLAQARERRERFEASE
jgi:hypothetical protein